MSARRILVSMGLAAMSGLALAQVNSDDGTLPLQASRTIEFSAEEGTWVSLDVTPDGRSIVFDLLGDLYRLPIEGGAARRITQGMAYDAQPRVSPDGRSIAFISDRSGEEQLWVARIDGSEPRRLSDKQGVTSPAWTPDSRSIVASLYRELMLYSLDGGSGIPVDLGNFSKNPYGIPTGEAFPLGAVMSADGRFLYFAASVGSDTVISRAEWQIHRRDMHSAEVAVLTSRLGGAFRPALAPDGKRLVYATRYEARTGLRVLDLESREDRWLIYPVQTDNAQSGNDRNRDVFPGYAFLPDGKALVLASEGKIRRVALESGIASIIPFSAPVALQIGADLSVPYRLDEGPVRVKVIQSPQLSPDGRRLVFSALTKLYVQDLPAGQPRRLTQADTREFQPVWSPDGRWIAYVSWGPQGGHVWKMSADGRGKPQRLTRHAAYYSEIAFSADGARIVGIRGSAQQRLEHHMTDNLTHADPMELVWLPAAGGEVRWVAPAADIRGPHFTADPHRIYFNTLGGSLSSLRFDGSDRRTHLRLDSNLGVPKPSLMHPSGRWALAKLADQIYLIAVPPGEGAAVDVRTPSVPVKRLTDIGADYFAWGNGGNSITWGMGSTFYRRALESIDWATPVARKAGEAHRVLEEDAAVTAVQVRLEFPRAKPSGTLVLRHASALTMKGQEVIRDADIVVQDNRIAAIGPAGQVSLPRGAREVDVSGKFVLPGFIDAHTDWTLRSQNVLQPDDWVLKANLAYGVTAGLDAMSRQDFFVYQDMVEAGLMSGPRLFLCGPAVRGVSANFQSFEQTRDYLRRYSDHYRTRYIMGFTLGERRQRQWTLMAAKELGLMPTLEGMSEIDFTHMIDGFHGHEYALAVTPFYQDAVELFARSGTAYTPALTKLYDTADTLDYFIASENPHDDPKVNRFILHRGLDFLSRRRDGWARKDEYRFADAAVQAAKIQRAGSLVGVAGHGELQGLNYHWEMWALGTAMKPHEVLQAATIDGARILGLAQDLGSLEPGKLADMVVLDKNPLKDIRNTNTVHYVMKNGELYEGDTLRQIWPRERPMPHLQLIDSPSPIGE